MPASGFSQPWGLIAGQVQVVQHRFNTQGDCVFLPLAALAFRWGPELLAGVPIIGYLLETAAGCNVYWHSYSQR